MVRIGLLPERWVIEKVTSLKISHGCRSAAAVYGAAPPAPRPELPRPTLPRWREAA